MAFVASVIPVAVRVKLEDLDLHFLLRLRRRHLLLLEISRAVLLVSRLRGWQPAKVHRAGWIHIYRRAQKPKKFESGDQNIASLLNISKPHLEGSTIQFSVPSDMNKVELEREFTEFVPYLRTSLQNHDLSIKVIVDEKTEKNFIYTADEKYERLKEINPMIDLLRQEFDLDV